MALSTFAYDCVVYEARKSMFLTLSVRSTD